MLFLCYLYRFKDFYGKIIYVGRAKNLLGRLSNHSHKKNENKEYEQICSIEFLPMKSEAEMMVMEKYYINLYKPKCNVADIWDGDVDRNLESSNWIRFEDYFIWKNHEQYMNICKQYSLAINQFKREFRMDLFSYCVGVDCGEWELDYGKKKYYDIYKKYYRFAEQKEQLKFRKNSYIGMMEYNQQRMLSDKDALEYYLRMREVIKTIKQANS